MANHQKPIVLDTRAPEGRNGDGKRIECVGLIRGPDGIKAVRVIADESQIIWQSNPDVWAVTKNEFKKAAVQTWKAAGLYR